MNQITTPTIYLFRTIIMIVVSLTVFLTSLGAQTPDALTLSQQYKLSFDVNGGVGTADTIIVTNGEQIGTLPVVTRSGYTFVSWVIDGVDLIDETVNWVYDSNKTAVAEWDANEYTLSFDMNITGDETFDQPKDFKIKYDATIDTLPVVARIGYSFDGWFVGTTKLEVTSVWKYEENKEAIAHWSKSSNTKYVVIHLQENISDDNYILKEQEDLTGTTSSNVTPVVKTYVGFVSPSTQTVTINADGSTEVKYYYNRTRHSLEYVIDEEKCTTNDVLKYNNIKYGSNAPIIVVTAKTGYRFVGWDKPLNVVEEDVVYTAVYRANQYTLSFDKNGGVGVISSLRVTYKSAMGSLPEITRKGYLLKSWQIDDQDIDETTIWTFTEDKIARASWGKNTGVIKFDANGGEGTMVDQEYELNKEIQLKDNAFTRTGYTFLGWSTTSTANDAEYSNKSIYVDDELEATLYAVWEVNSYRIVFNSNDGKANAKYQELTYGVPTILFANEFVRDGWAFKGWAYDKKAKQAEIQDKEEYTIGANGKMLYAVWEVDKARVQMRANTNTHTDMMMIEINRDDVVEFIIVNQNGVIAKRFPAMEPVSEISIGDLANGIYILRAKTEDGKYHTTKFIKR